MGWLFGWNTRKELETHLLSLETWHPTHPEFKLLRHAWVGNNLWVLIPSQDHATGNFTGPAVVVLFKVAGRNNSRDGWGYKDMDESMGPNEVNCPLSFVEEADRQGPATGSYAPDWRRKVHAFHAAKAAARELAKPGTFVQLIEGCAVHGEPVTVAEVRKKEGRTIMAMAAATKKALLDGGDSGPRFYISLPLRLIAGPYELPEPK